VGLADRARHRVATYSGGMKRRLNLAVALVHDPPLLLLDEPTVGVDPQSRHALLEAVKALRDQGRAIVYTTHYMEEVESASDRVAIVDHGKLLDLDTVDALIARHGGRPELVLERPGGAERIPCEDPVARLQQIAAAGPLPPFRVERPSLESVFLGLTGRSLRD
jgi:ABC-2 type transport system ATP-binding protein